MNTISSNNFQTNILTSQQILVSVYNKLVKNQDSIQSQQKKWLGNQILNRNIQNAQIRQVLSHEGQPCHHFFYIIQGSVSLSKKVLSKQRYIVAILTPGQIVNLQAKINQWKVKYTATVNSSSIKYLTLSDDQIHTLFPQNELNDIKKLQQQRDQKYLQKAKKIKKEMLQDRRKKIVNRMSLPQLKFKSNFSEKQQQTQQQQQPSLALKTAYHNIDSEKKFKSKSQQKIEVILKQSRVKPLSLKQIQKVPSVQLKRQQQTKKSLIKDDQYIKQMNKRNEKLFKQQLKHIIKRKLLYEKKHLTVLKAFRDEQKLGPNKSLKKQENKYTEQVDENHIDEYFIM